MAIEPAKIYLKPQLSHLRWSECIFGRNQGKSRNFVLASWVGTLLPFLYAPYIGYVVYLCQRLYVWISKIDFLDNFRIIYIYTTLAAISVVCSSSIFHWCC